MKATVLSIIILAFVSAGAVGSAKKEKILIKTSAQCTHCEENISKALSTLDGIKSVKFDEARNVWVTYDTEKTEPGRIKEVIAAAGYDADDVKADGEVYQKLADCCKKPEDRKTE